MKRSPARLRQGYGAHPPTTCNLSYLHDFIHFTIDELSDLGPQLRPLYEKGHSLKEISAMTGLPFSTVRSQLLAAGVTFQAKVSVSSTLVLRQRFKNSAPPPFGYCYLDGHLQKDPREYPTLQIIKQQWRQGKTPTEITRYLNGRKIKTRTGKQWKQPTVFYIIERLKNLEQESKQ